MFNANFLINLRALTFIALTILFLNGCSTYNALEGGKEPGENAAHLYISPVQEYVGIGLSSVLITHLDGMSIEGFWDSTPSKIILNPGKHQITLKYRYSAWCYMGCLIKREKYSVLVLDAKRGHHYRGYARSEGDNYWAWIEDEATGEVVSGHVYQKPDEAKARIEETWQTRLAHADCGNADAQYHLAIMLKAGTEPAKEDRIAAYKWISIAAQAGHSSAIAMKPVYAKSLNPEQLAEVDREVADWKPNCSDKTITSSAQPSSNDNSVPSK